MNSIQEEQITAPEPEEPPMSYDEAKLERLAFEAPPGLEEPIKTKTRQMSREYMRQYYHKHKAEIVYPFCNITYTCKSSLVKHQRKSLKCGIQRINNVFSDFTEESVRIRDDLHKLEVATSLNILHRLANKTKSLNKNDLKK